MTQFEIEVSIGDDFFFVYPCADSVEIAIAQVRASLKGSWKRFATVISTGRKA